MAKLALNAHRTRANLAIELRLLSAKRAPIAAKICAGAAQVTQFFVKRAGQADARFEFGFARGACKFGAERATNSLDFRRSTARFRCKTRTGRCKNVRRCRASHAKCSAELARALHFNMGLFHPVKKLLD